METTISLGLKINSSNGVNYTMNIIDVIKSVDKVSLHLSNGYTFIGHGLNINKPVNGELCFNTGMTGYQETITDPSYCGQIIIFTSAHIGITGINEVDYESQSNQANGIIINNFEFLASNFRSSNSLYDFIKAKNIPVIFDTDTRQLVKLIRNSKQPIIASVEKIREKNKEHMKVEEGQISGQNLIYPAFDKKYFDKYLCSNKVLQKKNIVVIDFGIKNSIIRELAKKDHMIHVLPCTTSFNDILKLNPLGIVLSNGPGDPRCCPQNIVDLINDIKKLNVPVLGICYGGQILAHSYGLELYQLETGHHGVNHPVLELHTNKIYITSHNHEFAIKDTEFPDCLEKTFISLFDNTIEGFKDKQADIYVYQFHPEAGPGPNEAKCFIYDFLNVIDSYAKT